LDPDRQQEEAKRLNRLGAQEQLTEAQVAEAAHGLLKQAAAPLANNPTLRKRLVEMRQALEQTYDTISQDTVLVSAFSEDAKEKAKGLITSFEHFIKDNKDEITALQVLYSQPHGKRLRFADIKALVEAIQAPPRRWTPELLWQAYEVIERDKVRRTSGQRMLTDIVSLVRFALHQEQELLPYQDKVEVRFQAWLLAQDNHGKHFSPDQVRWLGLMKDHIVASLGIEMDDFDLAPFAQHGGAGKAYQVFGPELKPLIDELNEVLAA
jgi:type I restriction enzyme R subunit